MKPPPRRVAQAEGGGNAFKMNLEAMLAKGRGKTHMVKPKEEPKIEDTYKIELFAVPEEERQEKLSVGQTKDFLAMPQAVQSRRQTKKYDAAKYDFDNF